MTSKGIINKNPGNIRVSSIHWHGKLYPSQDTEFETFDTAQNGIRAIAKILLTYYNKYKLDTVRAIISRWAPDVENDTQAYINDVCDRCGFDPDAHIDLRAIDDLVAITHGIIIHENGQCPYTIDEITIACKNALLT